MRMIDFTAVAANVAMHPHSPDLYRQLFSDAYDLKRSVLLRGDRNALISTITPRFSAPGFTSPVVTGTIATFLEFDKNAPWLDMETLQQADDDLTRSVSIPERLRAGLACFNFLFDPESHVIVAETEAITRGDKEKVVRLSAGMLANFLSKLFALDPLYQKYGSVAVTAVPDPKGVEQILSAQNLRQLTIMIRPPNADVLEDLAEEIGQRILEQGAATFREQLTAPRGGTLTPSEETKNLARVGALNGRVEAKVGKSSGGSASLSTAMKPAEFEGMYDADAETSVSALRRVAVGAVEDVRKARQLKVPSGAEEAREVTPPRGEAG